MWMVHAFAIIFVIVALLLSMISHPPPKYR